MSRPDDSAPPPVCGEPPARLQLQPRHLQPLDLTPGCSLELEIEATWSGPHTLRCFGPTGLLLELRDEAGATLELLALDDVDAPTTSPRRRVTLERGRRYLLKVRPLGKDFEGTFRLLLW